MRYFVTGATGFIGGRLVRQLIQRGHQVTALVRRPEAAGDLRELGIDIRQGDITDRRSLPEGMAGADGVFHLAAWYKLGARDISQAEAINVEGTRNVLETMKELRIPRGVYTSSLAVFSDTHGEVVEENYRHDGPWLSEYDRTKWAAHYQVALPMIRSGLPLIIVQPGVAFGPGDPSSVRQTFVDYLQRKVPLLPAKAAYCWAHVEDTAMGHILAMERGRIGESYIIAGEPQSLVDVFYMAEAITGIHPPRFHAPPVLLQTLSRGMALVERVMPLPDTYTSESLRVTAGATYLGCSKKAREELGWAPESLETGLRETLLHEMKLLNMPLPYAGGTGCLDGWTDGWM